MTFVAASVGVESKPGVDSGYRQANQPAVFGQQVFAIDNHIMARRIFYHARRHRIGDRVGPFGRDAIDRRIHAGRVDILVGSERTDDDRDIVLTALGVCGVRKQKRFALIFAQAAPELPAHKRRHFGVLVYGLIDDIEKVSRLELVDMLLKIPVYALACGGVHLALLP